MKAGSSPARRGQDGLARGRGQPVLGVVLGGGQEGPLSPSPLCQVPTATSHGALSVPELQTPSAAVTTAHEDGPLSPSFADKKTKV